MPIFHLKPIPASLDHADWASSTFRGEAWVNATTAEDARGLASGKFQDGGATITGTRSMPSPWRASELVAICEVAEGPSGMTIPENTVVASQQILG